MGGQVGHPQGLYTLPGSWVKIRVGVKSVQSRDSPTTSGSETVYRTDTRPSHRTYSRLTTKGTPTTSGGVSPSGSVSWPFTRPLLSYSNRVRPAGPTTCRGTDSNPRLL